MLPQEFFDWWFEPWNYAPAALHPLASDRVARRDGYRLWCDAMEIPANLPQEFDAGWQVAVADEGAQLIATARLFGGLVAARAHDDTLLRQLSIEERRWCVSIASTQPLVAADVTCDDDIALRGLVELARRLERNFPGMWPRLRLLLSPEQAERSTTLAGMAAGQNEGPAARAQRCWSLCSAQAMRLRESEPLAA